MTTTLSKRTRSFLSAIILLACILLAWRHFSKHPESLDVLWAISLSQLAMLLALHGMLLAINTIRFRLILQKCAERPIPLKPWITLFVHGRFLNTFVPQLGNVYRSIALKQNFDVSYTRYVTTLVAVGWISTALNIWFAWLLIIFFSPIFQLGDWSASTVVATLATCLVIGPFVARQFFRVLMPNTQRRFVLKINEVLDVTTTIVTDTAWFGKVLGLSLLAFVVACFNIHLCFTMVQASPLIGETALFYTLLQLSNLIKFTPGNLGPQEVAFGLLGAQSTVGMSEGILAGALFRVGAVLTLCLASVLILPMRKGQSK